MFELKNVYKKYENGYIAISDISLEIGKVGLVAITGESGAGKTTLLNLLAKNDNITSGSVKFCKKELSECTESEIAQQFAFIFQDYKLIENMTVLENLSIAVELAGLPVDMSKIDNYLQKYKLQEHKNNKVSTLSGGQKQRISIIRALLRQPKVIFADEPTGNLDTQNTETIFEELKEIAKTQLVILVSHDKESVNKFADRVINLIDGKIATDSANNHSQILAETTAENTAETIEKTAETTAKTTAETTETVAENTAENTAENKRGKGSLQTKTAVKTAFSFYKIKSTRNILTILAILLVSILLFTTINLSCLNYEKMVINSVKKSDSNGIILSHRGTNSNYFKAQASTPFGNHLVASSYNSDLSAVKGEIEKELNIESANVYNLLISFNKRLNHYANYKNGEVISRMDNIYLGMEMERALLCDDILKIGIKLINGREPKGVNECLIPKFFMDILLKMKFSIVNYEEETEVPEFEILEFNNEQDVYNHSFGSYKVVGVFEDNFVADKKIAGLDFNGKLDGKILSEDKREKIADKISMNIRNYPLLNTIIMSENNLENFTNINNISIGNNQEASEQYRFSATEGNCFVFSVDTENLLANGKICLGEQEKKNLKDTAGNPVEVGSKIKLKLNHIVGGAIVGFENVEFVIAKFEGYKNIISAGDYKKLFGGYVLPPQAIYFNKENLKPTDLKRISKIVENNFAKTEDDSIRYEYLGNNTISLHNDYSTFAFIKNFVIIPFTIVLALLLGFMMSLFVINIVNKNAEEIVILRVLGANNRQIFKIFAVFLPIILLAEFVTAVALGSAIVYSMQGYLAISEYSTMFYVAGVAVALLGAIMVVVNIIALMSTFLLRCKNIRQSFQKIEEA